MIIKTKPKRTEGAIDFAQEHSNKKYLHSHAQGPGFNTHVLKKINNNNKKLPTTSKDPKCKQQY